MYSSDLIIWLVELELQSYKIGKTKATGQYDDTIDHYLRSINEQSAGVSLSVSVTQCKCKCNTSVTWSKKW